MTSSTPTSTPTTIYRRDYQPYPFTVLSVDLAFDLHPQRTTVNSTLRLRPLTQEPQAIVLDGEDIELVSLGYNGRLLDAQEYQLQPDRLVIFNQAQPETELIELQITTAIRPDQNHSLMGLYLSNQQFFTQCEAEGFRRITYYPDRPDVLSEFRVTLVADQAQYPFLLSNGNLISQNTLEDGRHQAVWHDPFKKPAYLFALVAGDFDLREKTITTADGREVLLQVYSDKGTLPQTEWAMDCLVSALRWDEQRFNLCLDLDRYMIVAAHDFNMGAMENKGLNIFNATYVLADPQTATDDNYAGVEAVIGHEYFHNWTGNRVTCRDWFQLSLKEGLTIFREQAFCADMMAHGLDKVQAASARAVKRIEDVTILRTHQFPEDAGPMAHPIRPESYQEISNFYTHTIYEKGAEVIRMLHTMLGEATFQQGIQRYLQRHDGQAATCDDFLDAMEWAYQQAEPTASLAVFRRWYHQAGTPTVTVRMDYHPEAQQCRLSFKQHCPKVGVERLDEELQKLPFHIPIAVGFLDASGQAMTVEYRQQRTDSFLIHLTEESQTVVIDQVSSAPIPSLLRDFSAPVYLDYDYDKDELVTLACHDSNQVNRWEAAQQLARREILRLYAIDDANATPYATTASEEVAAINENSDAAKEGSTTPEKATEVSPALLAVWQHNLEDATLVEMYQATLLTLPSLKQLMESIEAVDPQRLVRVYDAVELALAQHLYAQWSQHYHDLSHALDQTPYQATALDAGRRRLKHLALRMMALAEQATSANTAESPSVQGQASATHDARDTAPSSSSERPNLTAHSALDAAQAQFEGAQHMTDQYASLALLVHFDRQQRGAAALAAFYQQWQSYPLVIDKWFSLQAVARATDLPEIEALMAHPKFEFKNPNRMRAVLSQFALNNVRAFHQPDGAPYYFLAQHIIALDKFNPELSARLARIFEQWHRYAEPYQTHMKGALAQLSTAPGISANLNEIVSKALHQQRKEHATE